MKKENKHYYPPPIKEIREFKSGATRDTEGEKLDYDGFLSPLALHVYAKYLNKHRIQSDGTLRESDNWQKGISRDVYMKSIWRHQMDVWAIHRGYHVYKERTDKGEVTHILLNITEWKNPGWIAVTLEDALGGLIFNSMGYLHEYIKLKYTYVAPEECAENVKHEPIKNGGFFEISDWEDIMDFLEEFREK
jgi:hypothetical protein